MVSKTATKGFKYDTLGCPDCMFPRNVISLKISFYIVFQKTNNTSASSEANQFIYLTGPSKVVKNDLQKERTNSQTALETELKKVHHHLELNQRLLEDLAVEHSEWDQEVKAVKSHAVHSANLDWEMGLRQPSNNTLQIDADLSQAQQNCQTIKKRIQEVSQEIQLLHAKQDYLCNEIRPSPTGVAGAEQVPSHGRPITTWHETDIDSGKNFNILSQFRLCSVSVLS